MGGLQFCESPPELVFESVDGFGCDDARDPHYHVFLDDEHFLLICLPSFVNASGDVGWSVLLRVCTLAED